MPVLLFGIGFFAFVAGLAMIGFGVPINEFSFGNTLIGAGTTAAVGGLVIIAVGVVGRAAAADRRDAGRSCTSHTGPSAAAPGRALNPPPSPAKERGLGAGSGPAVAPALPPAPGRAPFPPRAKADLAGEPGIEPVGRVQERRSMDEQADVAPSLRNPDEPSLPLDDGITLSPRHPQAAPVPAATPPGSLDRTSDSFGWRVPPPAPGAPGASGGARVRRRGRSRSRLTSMPCRLRRAAGQLRRHVAGGGKGAKAPIGAKPEPKSDALAREAVATRRAEPEKPRAVAILKSGVVDGMGYTLYVDGSIEAELPQGTLRFASINELRSHLEKNT